MPLSKARDKERIQSDYRVKVDRCGACHRIAPIHRHHLKPSFTVQVCASCHKRIHLCMAGKQRTKFNPYINPLVKLGIDEDGNPIYDE